MILYSQGCNFISNSAYDSNQRTQTGLQSCESFHIYNKSSKEHYWSPCDGSVKSGGPLCCIKSHKLRSNQVYRTKCLRQDVGAISITEV